MSPVAYSLYTYLRRRADGDNVVMEELVRVLRSSKTAIRAAFEELSQEGLLSYSQEA
jgi:DNA-binding GntR family transcriptional regulator